MGKLKTTPYDVADYLRTPEHRAAYLEATLEDCDGDIRAVMNALNNIARSEGMTHVARKAKLSRESLYKSLSGTRSPEFSTVVKIMAVLGLQLQVVAKAAS
jgi:probable addiction module antidote protein